MSTRTAVVAIGGNSLIIDKDHQTVPDQYAAAGETTGHIAEMIASGWNVAISHGNGPQVGFILRRSELAAHELHEVPLDVCGADSQGAIGYALQQNLYNHFERLGIARRVATIVTQVEVAADDPAFKAPDKPIGSFMEASMAELRIERDGWQCFEDAGRGWRRVVASPLPIRIVELPAITHLIEAGIVTITVGGGGVPVVRDGKGLLRGVPAVIDKDRASALLATKLRADLLLISTSVEKVALNYRTPDQQWLDHLTVADAKRYLALGTHFAAGSMAPKIASVIEFIENGGERAIITDPKNIMRALNGETGTHVTL